MDSMLSGAVIFGMIVLAVLILAFIIARDGRRASDYSGKGVGRATGYQAKNDAAKLRVRSYKVMHSKPRITPNATRKPRERIEVAMSRSYEQEPLASESTIGTDAVAPPEQEPVSTEFVFEDMSLTRILKRKKDKAKNQKGDEKKLSLKPLVAAVGSTILAIVCFILSILFGDRVKELQFWTFVLMGFFGWYAWKNIKLIAASLKNEAELD
ncbi:hypothetical protein [Pseudodesulfovibrio sediminis]|uniref:Uncharacterized protein n=1 Tax=Pseudodesulfovibrio sediminis TaxID=2810563 RepID=A0ABN6EUQ6_9BACT|nr:hypothetical protein [Pseudodesulfovibrio sediminis]BCS88779.1 hypothetical protein PSDVSF_20210 [Pseudodesulfovibrio sediminis]